MAHLTRTAPATAMQLFLAMLLHSTRHFEIAISTPSARTYSTQRHHSLSFYVFFLIDAFFPCSLVATAVILSRRCFRVIFLATPRILGYPNAIQGRCIKIHLIRTLPTNPRLVHSPYYYGTCWKRIGKWVLRAQNTPIFHNHENKHQIKQSHMHTSMYTNIMMAFPTLRSIPTKHKMRKGSNDTGAQNRTFRCL